MEIEPNNIEIACPECGKDVCVLHDTKRKWTHRSRVIPRIVWAAACLGLIGYWVSTGRVHFVQDEVDVLIQSYGGAPVGQIPTSFQPEFGYLDDPELVLFVSKIDLQEAMGGDPEAMSHVLAKLREAVVYNEHLDEGGLTIKSVVFGWKESYGSYYSSTSYFFGGPLLMFSSGKMVPDMRDLDTVGRYWYQGDWGAGGLLLFPRLGYRTSLHDGAANQEWSISLIGVFGIFSMVFILVWVAGIIAGLVGVRVAGRRSIQVGLFFVLFVAVAATSYFGVYQYTSLRAGAYGDIVQSKVYSIAEMEALTGDENEAMKLIEDLLGLFATNPQGPNGLGYAGEELLAQFWSRDLANVKNWPQTTNDRFDLLIGYGWPLLNYERLNYIDLQDGQEVTVLVHDSTWEYFRKRGMLTLRWGPPEHRASLSIGIVTWISIGVLFWLIWKFVHWCARFIIGRVQKRRVIGNQCIFCAYPLTQEATQARYPQVAP